MRQGTEGCVQDYRIFGDPWGFALEEIEVPGPHLGGLRRPDRAARLPRLPATGTSPHATVTVVPGEGHLSLLPHQAPGDLRLVRPWAATTSAESMARWNVG